MPTRIKILLSLTAVLLPLITFMAFRYWIFNTDSDESPFDHDLAVVLLCLWFLFPFIMAVIFQIKPLKADPSGAGKQHIRLLKLLPSCANLIVTLAMFALLFEVEKDHAITVIGYLISFLYFIWLLSFIGFQVFYFSISSKLYRANPEKTGFLDFHIISGYAHMMINFFVILAMLFGIGFVPP